MSDVVYIALGSNIGDRNRTLERARAAIAGLKGTRIVAESTVEETEPIGPIQQANFLNQMIAIQTSLEPHALLVALHRIERAAGRLRVVRWGPRTLDLDIVMIEGRAVDEENFKVPHPELRNREFWQRELRELGVTVNV